VKLVAVADTHGYHRDLAIPNGDVFLHAGDLTQRGTLEQLAEVAE
jgi:predicted phosphodiesterase